ncbi:Reticulon-like protein B8, partial [Mucuna pruriens]
MSEKITAENLLNTLVETLAEKQKSVSFFEEEKSSSVSSQFNRLFGRQKPVHHLLGAADVLLWRNKKISASVLSAATAIWVLFEWLNYNFLTLLFFVLALVMLGQFLWTNASGLFSSSNMLCSLGDRKQSKVPRFVLPDNFFVNIATTVGAEVNMGLRFLQDVACEGNLKQFLLVVVSLWAGAVIGSWCNFLTVMYIGFVAAHTLPVLYERYEDQVDTFVYKVFDQMQNNYQKLDSGLLSKIPKGKLKGKKLKDVTREQSMLGSLKFLVSRYLTGDEDFINDCCKLVKAFTRCLILTQFKTKYIIKMQLFDSKERGPGQRNFNGGEGF